MSKKLLIFLALLIEVSPYFHGTKVPSIFFVCYLFVLFVKSKKKFHVSVWIWILILLFLSLLQNIVGVGRGMAPTIATILWSVITPYLLYRLVGMKSFDYLYEIINTIAKYSFFLWVAFHIIPPFGSLLRNVAEFSFNNFNIGDTIPRALLIYTIPFHEVSFGIFRNNGLFHEPGAFGFWIIFSLVIHLIKVGNIFETKNIFLLLSLVTTFSTGAYLSLALLIILQNINSNMNSILKISSLLIILTLFFILYKNINFLENKISLQYQNEALVNLDDVVSNDRFVRLRKTINAISISPFIGHYADYETNKTLDSWERKMSIFYVGSASFGVFVTKGIFIGLLFYFFFFRGLKYFYTQYRMNDKKIIILMLFLLFFVNGMSQRFIDDSITNLFFVIGLTKVKF